MLTLIEDLPENVVGVEAHGKVTSEDYERVLVPAVLAAIAKAGDGRIRLMYVVGHEFPDYTAGALGRTPRRSWAMPIGFVTPSMASGEIRVFAPEELDSARAWVTSMPPDQVRIY